MKYNTLHDKEIDENGNLVIPKEIKEKFEPSHGSAIRVEKTENEVHIVHPRNNLSRVYVEPTNRCTQECRTCIHNVWDGH